MATSRAFACAFVCLFSAPLWAQPSPSPSPSPAIETAPLFGQLLRRGTRAPLAGVAVFIAGAQMEARTDDDGRFSFTSAPVGKQTLAFRGAAIKAAQATIQVVERQKTTATFYLDGAQSYESTVHSQSVVQEVVRTELSGDEIRRIPGTQGDLLRAAQNLPGVARAPFGGGLLPVWGSSPEDTRSYVDGVFIPTLYHFGGLRSTINSEMVSSLSFTPGGYSAEFGRGTGGLIQVETRAPRDDAGVHGFVQLDLIDFSAMLEAKLPRKLSIAIGFRRSVLDWVRKLPISTFSLAPTYYDYQLKLNWKPSSRDELELFIFGSDDQLQVLLDRPNPDLTGQFDSHVWFVRALGKWMHRFGRGTLTLTTSVGYEVPFQLGGGLGNSDIEVGIQALSYTLKLVSRLSLAGWLRLDLGVDYEGFRWDVNAQAPVQGLAREGDNSTLGINGAFGADHSIAYQNLFAPFFTLNFSFFHHKLVIVPQLRLDLYSTAGYLDTADANDNRQLTVEPRLNLRYQALGWLAIKAAVGIYDEPPDITSFSRVYGNPRVLPLRSTHYVFGFDVDPTSTLHIEAVGFYKDLRDLVVRAEKPGAPPLSNDGIGRVYGGDFLVRQQLWKHFFGWVSYTLSRSDRRDHPDQPWRIFQYDQTHILTLVASYQLPRNYQIGVRFRYTTGNPYTPVVDHYFDAAAVRYLPVYGPTYGARLASFNQLDVRVDKTWTFNRYRFAVYLDIQNIYNFRGEEGVAYNYDYTQKTSVRGLPILPALGLRGEF